MVDDSFFCVSAVLDPSFKLKWCYNEEKAISVKQMVANEIDTLIATATDITNSSNANKGTPPPSKKARLFAFMDAPAIPETSEVLKLT